MNFARPRTIIIRCLFLALACRLFAQEHLGTSEDLKQLGLNAYIEQIDNLIHRYTLAFYKGNKLFIPVDTLSPPLFYEGKISPISGALHPVNQPEIEISSISQLQTTNGIVHISPPLSVEEDTILLEIETVLPKLPELMVYEQISEFSLLILKIYQLYSYDNILATFVVNSSKFELFGLKKEDSVKRRKNLPGSPLLTGWQTSMAENDEKKTQESRILIQVFFDSQGKLSKSYYYNYNSSGEFYELEQVSPQDQSSFVVLNEEEMGLRELIIDDTNTIRSSRRYDDQGRLQARSISDDAPVNWSRTTINYLEDGKREESDIFPSGEEVLRQYNEDNYLVYSFRSFPNGKNEEQFFSYTPEGEILRDEYRGVQGTLITEYEYKENSLHKAQTTKDGVITRLIENKGDNSIETYYVRGEAVLRVYFENEKRIAEEELFKGEILRYREYIEEGNGENNESTSE